MADEKKDHFVDDYWAMDEEERIQLLDITIEAARDSNEHSHSRLVEVWHSHIAKHIPPPDNLRQYMDTFLGL
jgi:hypothetical protein